MIKLNNNDIVGAKLGNSDIKLCIGSTELYSPALIVDGYEAIDLGLPSGTLWATMNVGALVITDYGNYYQYGKGTLQYAITNAQDDYTGTEDPLNLSVDTVRQVMGGQWHIPTQTQVQELFYNTTYSWEDSFNGSGIKGGRFTASNGKYIFFPATGYWSNNKLKLEGNFGYYWISTPKNNSNAYYYRFNKSDKYISYGYRKNGLTIRGVVG